MEEVKAAMVDTDCDRNGKMNWYEVRRAVRMWGADEASLAE